MNRSEILKTADQLINSDRAKVYGPAKKNHEDIAKIWSVILGIEVTDWQVVLCMAGVKIARASNPDTYNRDNFVDGAAYLSMTNALLMKKNGDL